MRHVNKAAGWWWRRRWSWLWKGRVDQILLILLALIPALNLAADCDVTITSSPDLPKNGTFKSTNYPRRYPDSTRCIYMFIAGPNERVQVKFTDFEVKGVHPMCSHDYVDVYTQVRDPEEDLLEVPLHGRYCGHDLDTLPHLFISMGNILVVGFYTDDSKNDRGFKAEYQFIDGSVYVVGTPAAPSVCGQTIRGESVPRGTLLSPTYPGIYPDNIFCYYKLVGVPGDRIRFTFIDLDLYSGGEHCPFDYVKIHDGYTNQDKPIGTYCGKLRNFDIYSTGEALHIEFVTTSGRVEPTKKAYVPYWEIEQDSQIQRKGFKATFEIGRKFVDISFIRNGHNSRDNEEGHVRGTECDQRVLSKGESNGTITSPNFPNPYPLNVTCKYYIDGLVDRENLEKAKLSFDAFDVPRLSSESERCDNGYMSAYIRGQDMTRERADQMFCGDSPPQLVTTNPRLLLIFNTTGVKAGRGFKATYQFVTDYAIPGTPATDSACHFTYNSDSHKKWGTFNSARYPSNYPPDTLCNYEFDGFESEQVRLTFENFNLENNCSHDSVKVYSVQKVRGVVKGRTLIGQFCGDLVPGPLVSDTNSMQVIMETDGEKHAPGFRARYEFIERKPTSKQCSRNITSGAGGLITSPNYPIKYSRNATCDTHIYATTPGARIMLQFDQFSMEGHLEQLGCGKAVLRIYTGNTSIESGLPTHSLCGPNKKNLPPQIISQGNYIRLQFISSANAVGAKGYKITWTELYPLEADGSCRGFQCELSGHCISASLKCNNKPNCGVGVDPVAAGEAGEGTIVDDSDEQESQCRAAYTDDGILHIILGAVIALIVLVFLIVCILHRRRKIRKKKNKKEIEVRFVTRSVTYSAANKNGGQGSNDYADRTLLKERTEKVSIV